MDWIRLTQHAKDLAGRKGSRLRAISLDEVASHASEFDCWTVFRGRVYNLSPYLPYHPGGKQILLNTNVAGADCTALFDKYHRWVNGSNMLQTCEVGWLDKGLAAGPAVAEADEEDDENKEEEVVVNTVGDALDGLRFHSDRPAGGTA